MNLLFNSGVSQYSFGPAGVPTKTTGSGWSTEPAYSPSQSFYGARPADRLSALAGVQQKTTCRG